MRIDGWRVDGFGVFSGASVQDLPPGLTIVSGPNEAGKSTLLAFVRGVLFGFPDGRSKVRRHEPVHGGRHGGAVSMLDADGGRWVVERHQQPRAFSLRAPDGTLAEDHRLRDLLGHADASLFANVFAFGLGELDSFELLDSEEIRDRVFAAGVVGGGRSAGAALNALDERRTALLRPRGRCTIRDLADETRAATRRLGSARAGAQDLVRRREEVAVLLAETVERRSAVESSLGTVRRASILLDAWPAQRHLVEVEDELASLGPLANLEDDVVLRLAATRADLMAASAAHDQATDDLAAATARRDAIHVDAALEGVRESVAEVAADLGAEEVRTERLSELDGVVDTRRAELDHHLRRLGPEWDRVHLTDFDVSIPAAEEVRRLGERSSALQAELEERTTRRDSLRLELGGIEEELGGAEPEVDDDREARDLERRSRALRQLRADLVDLGGETSRLDAANGAVAGLTSLSSKGGRRTSSMGIVFVVAGVVLGVAGAAALWSDVGPLGAGLAITGVSAVVLGIMVLSRGRTSASPDVVAGVRSELRDARRARDDVQARIDLLRTRIQASALVLGLSPEPGAEDVERCAEQIDESARSADERLAKRSRRSELEVRMGQLRRELAEAEPGVSAIEARVATDRVEWEQWARERRISPELGVGAVNDLFTGIERARAVLRELEAAEAERARLDEVSSRWRARASQVCAEVDGDETADPLAAVRVLSQRIARDEEARRSLDERAAAAAEAEARRTSAAGRLSSARRSLDAVWVELGATTDGEADEVVAQDRRRRSLVAEIDTGRAEVRVAIGRGPDADELVADLALGTVEDWEVVVREETERLPELEAAHDAAIRAHHDAERDLEHLSRAGDVADAGLQLETARTLLADAAEEWRTLTAARMLIAETLARYERERQPAVLARAEEWFAHITDDHYETVTVAEGEIVLVDAAGRRLTTDDLSRGTAEQLYLCLRFGLAAEMVAHSPLPFVMDDVLVNFDPERTQRMAEVLASIAADHQILLFTCQPTTVEALLAASPEARVIELPRHGGVASPA